MLNQFPNTYWFEPTPETRFYKTPGTFSFTIPEGVKKIFISCAPAAGGGGGGGGGETHTESNTFSSWRVYNNGTSGGGGGTKSIIYRYEISISEANSICTLIIGKGGTGGVRGVVNSSGGSGTTGESTLIKINNSIVLTANGGTGGAGGPGAPNRSASGGSDGGGTGGETVGKGSFINKAMYGGDGGYHGYGSRNPGSYAASSGQDGTNARVLVEWFDDDTPTGNPFQLLFPEIPVIYLNPILISK